MGAFRDPGQQPGPREAVHLLPSALTPRPSRQVSVPILSAATRGGSQGPGREGHILRACFFPSVALTP